MEEPLDILAFAPHPDDVELGCGGSLILAADKGWKVAVADLSDGEMSSRGTPELRQQEIQRSTKVLGLSARYAIGLPDSAIGTSPEHREPVIELIRQTRPRIVLAPYWEDRHPDHVRASHLVKEASFFAGVGKLGQGAPYRPSRLFYYLLHTPFTPTFILDVSSVWERRMAAVRAYESQFLSTDREATTALSHPSFLRSLEGRAMSYGWMIQAAYGEPFLSATPLSAAIFPGLQDTGGFPK